MTKEVGLESILIPYKDPISGVKQDIPSLDEKWAVDIDFLPYWLYPSDSLRDDQQLWLRSLEALRNDVIILLKLPLHRFWSEVIFDPKFHVLLDSFLKLTPVILEVTPDVLKWDIFQSFLEVMFKVFLRMGTNREAQYTKNRTLPDFSSKGFADLLYDNYLFDLPKILDLCNIFASNRLLLGEMLEGIFRKQNKYFYDIQEMIRTSLTLLQNVCTELGCQLKFSEEESKPILLEEKVHIRLSLERFTEIICFVTNLFSNLESFFATCPSASQCLCPLFIGHFIHFYENYVPAVVNSWLVQRGNLGEQEECIKSDLRRTKMYFCRILSFVFENCYFKKFSVTPVDLEAIQAPLEDFLTICSSVIGTKYLLTEYLKFFDLKKQFIDIWDSGIIDSIQYGYLTAPFDTNSEEPKSKPELNPELEQAIVTVQTIIPNLDITSIREVLILHNLNVPNAINTLFEQIPTVEIETRTKEVLVPKGPPSPELELVSQRKNIFSGDKFDIFSRDDVDINQIHIGKKEHFKDHNAFLNIRELTEKTRALAKLELEYEDEYDDTYDDIPCDVGVDTKGEETETIERLNPKGMYSNRYRNQVPDGAEGGEETFNENQEPRMVPFINRKMDNRG